MKKEFTEIILDYFKKVKAAGSESAKKETFKTLLNRIFGNDKSVKDLIDEMDLGAEKTVFNIPLKNRTKTGAADTQYRNVIIEFEKELKRTETHAKEQLREYFAGNWKSGSEYDFVLIATDCLVWKIYSPSFESIINKESFLPEDIDLEEKEVFELNEKRTEDFFYFIDHYLFRTQKQIPTYISINKDFGSTSSIFLNSIKTISKHFEKIKDNPEIKIVYEQWNLFLSIAYGSFKGSYDVFLIHTYLSILSKFIAYFVISRKDFIDDDEMIEILNGDIFNKYNINNFIDNDFYQWVSHDDHFQKLKKVFRNIALHISEYDFTKVDEDILKGVYQNLIDIETRHALGEYYTPDWLCEKMVKELKFKRNSMVLDPACGSGSFLRAAITELIHKYPDIKINELMSQIVGIDIHPLSVQISKTTVLLSVSPLLKNTKSPINIQIYLANTLINPEGGAVLFGGYFDVSINNKIYQIPKKIIKDPVFFDKAIDFCEQLAQLDKHQASQELKYFPRSLKNKFPKIEIDDEIIKSIYNIYLALKQAIENRCNSIWRFILQNSYKPIFLKEQFDFVIGNPPWLPYRDMKNEVYQDQLKKLAQTYQLVPKTESITHLELAAIFLSHCSKRFLKKTGELAFVLPRGFLSADHHDNTRNGNAEGFKIISIWDLQDVSPLFRITSCVFFCIKKDFSNQSQRNTNIEGFIVHGNLSATNLNLSEASKLLTFESVKWYFSKLGKRTAFSTKRVNYSSYGNYYLKLFKQGATIVPRNLYFVELLGEKPSDWRGRVLSVITDSIVKKDTKKPWDSIELKMRINSNFLFRTALSKNILPFALINPTLVHLPINIDRTQKVNLLSWQKIKELGYLYSAEWFKEVEIYWNKYKTEKCKNITYLEWLNYQNKITSQDLNNNYLVLYSTSAKDANATLVNREILDLPFIVESVAYWISLSKLNEAYYLISFLNSEFANSRIKSFQSSGLFGPRHIHKKILEIPLPKFDSKNEIHIEISKIGQKCIKKVEDFINSRTDNKKISGIRLGNIRLEIRELLKVELNDIDELLGKIIPSH